jgi:hypothetical protein
MSSASLDLFQAITSEPINSLFLGRAMSTPTHSILVGMLAERLDPLRPYQSASASKEAPHLALQDSTTLGGPMQHSGTKPPQLRTKVITPEVVMAWDAIPLLGPAESPDDTRDDQDVRDLELQLQRLADDGCPNFGD